MWNFNKITIITLLLTVGTLLFWILKLRKDNDMLNEFASFAAVSFYHINKDLEKNDYNYTKKSINESYKIIEKVKIEKQFKGKYWRDFDYYAFGITW